MPDIPDLNEQLVQALAERGASTPMLERFARHLRSRPANAPLPCPFCFGLGRESELAEQTRFRDVYTVRCHTCGDQFTLRVG